MRPSEKILATPLNTITFLSHFKGLMICFFPGLIADKLGSYEFAFYAAGSMILLSGAVQFLLLCFKNPTQREHVIMVDPEKTSAKNPCKDHKEYLASLYVESTMRKNNAKNASIESMQ